MRIKMRRHLAILLCVILLLALAPAGFAAVNLAPGANTVTVNLAPAESGFAEDLKGARVQADLYLLAAAEQAGDDFYKYTLPAEGHPLYAEMVKMNKDLLDDEKSETSPEQAEVFQRFAPYAQEFAGIVLGSAYTEGPTRTGSLIVDQTAITVTGLDAGLYLLIIRGSDLTTKDDNEETGYVRKTVQAAGDNNAAVNTIYATRVVTDDYEYLFQPQLLTVPTKLSDKNEQQYSMDDGNWVNDLTIYAKPSRETKNGDLKIIKDLTQPGSDPVTFVFEVTWTQNGTPMKKVVSMTFEGGQAYKEYILADTIPVGTEVTVTEVHSGYAYTAITGPQTATILAKPPAAADAVSEENAGIAEVRFDNDHSGPGSGHGILNRFTADENGNFEWTRYSDSADAADSNG